jgi:phosphopentomutase
VKELIGTNEDLKRRIDFLLEENRFLQQRNKELRQKTYIQVYDENLKLTEENKTLIKTIDQLREELIKVGKIADKYYQTSIDLKHQNKCLKDVIDSVEAFIQQFTK